ncbi:olfactory receptor [Striga asiatica]|uniref:Olfactory receptor n=1 Tax=Striga asiatica TaxID=4170 RepID=A0A5A7PB76_STRAF|nr:olfactory receptor [Striga asiatica]
MVALSNSVRHHTHQQPPFAWSSHDGHLSLVPTVAASERNSHRSWSLSRIQFIITLVVVRHELDSEGPRRPFSTTTGVAVSACHTTAVFSFRHLIAAAVSFPPSDRCRITDRVDCRVTNIRG